MSLKDTGYRPRVSEKPVAITRAVNSIWNRLIRLHGHETGVSPFLLFILLFPTAGSGAFMKKNTVSSKKSLICHPVSPIAFIEAFLFIASVGS
jgi:hypothetical protein